MVKKLTIMDVLEPFLSKPEKELHLADISRELDQPHPTARQHLNFLEKIGILKKKTKGRLTLYSLNFDNSLLIDYLVIAEKNMLIMKSECDLILKELVRFIHENISDSKVLIFGSAVQAFNKANDVDLLVAGKIDRKKITNFSKMYNKPIHIINVKNLGEVSETLKKEIVKKHLIIQSSEDIVGWLFW